jgi:tetratricopeptide (TPR) repeat protein
MKYSKLMKSVLTISMIALGYCTNAFCLTVNEQTEIYDSYAAEAKGNYDSAIQKMVKIQAANQDDYFVNNRLGYLFSMNKKYANALIHYQKAAQQKPTSLEPLLGMSLTAYYAGDDAKVITTSKEIFKVDAKNYYGLLRMAGAQIRLKDFDGALKTSSEGLKFYPLDPILLEQKAVALNTLGKVADAKHVAQDLILVSPSNFFAKTLMNPAPAKK